MWNANLPYVVLGCLPPPPVGNKFHGPRGMDLGLGPPQLPQRRLSDCNLNQPRRDSMSNILDCPSAMTCSGHASSSSCSEIMHDSGDYQWCLEYAYNREYNNGMQKKVQKSVLSSALMDTTEVSYDDLSKNIDANLAEIDMEDFCSEDIHSILSLPAMICAEGSHIGEKFASASNSVLQIGSVGTPAEEVSAFGSASSNRSSSENGSTTDMSICKDEPLFSPMKEHAQPIGGAISTDSLDCSGFEEPDLVLTCRANKTNYTIAFEGSGVQFSDDSDYLEGAEGTGSSTGVESGGSWQHDGRGGRMTPASGAEGKRGGDMIQSDMVFTTWSKLRRLKETTGTRRQSHHHQHVTLRPMGEVACAGTPPGGKSQSLPNLLRQSMMLAEIISNREAGQRLPIYDVQNSSGGSGSSSQLSHSRDSENSEEGPMSLLKLFIQQRGQSSLDSSSQSEASSSLGLLPPVLLYAPPDSHFYDLLGGRDPNDGSAMNASDDTILQETNNNNINYNEDTSEELNRNNNNNPLTLETGGGGSSEDSSSQCFEDSLVEAPTMLLKGRVMGQPASPIKEEEEQAGSSSGDETMRDLKDPFSSDSNTTEDMVTVTTAKNQNINNNNNNSGGNVFPTNHNHHHGNKLLNIACCTTSDEKLLMSKNLEDLVPASLSTQGTQTGKGLNQLGVPRQGKKKGDSSSRSSSRCSSLSQDSGAARTGWSSAGSSSKRISVSIATTRTCGTQIPVHIRDQEVQTCSSCSQEDLSSESQPWSFTLREDDQDTDTDDDTESDSDTEEIPVSTQRLEMREAASSPIDKDKKEKKSIYVCYPNYSLPDLSFLRNLSGPSIPVPGEKVVLNPTGRDRNSRQPAQRRSLSSEGRTRPKSCAADFDGMHNFGHIRDWESLKVLLPDEIRQLITSPKEALPPAPWLKSGPHYGVLRETPSVPTAAPLVPKRSLSLNTGQQGEPTRGILRKSSSAHQCSVAQQDGPCCATKCPSGAAEEARLKRRSLQEPFHCLLDNIPESQQPRLPLVPPREALPPFVRRCSREEIEEEEEDLGEVLVSSSSLALAHNLLANKNYNQQTSPLSSADVSPQQGQNVGCNCCMRHRKSVSFGRDGEDDSLSTVKDRSVLLKHLKAGVLSVLEWFELDLDNFEGTSSPTLETVVLEQLCPPLVAILSEGLIPKVNGLFGSLSNTPWRIAEASCQGDIKVRELQELVAYVNGESLLKDNTAKFNAFILGLLNLKHLEQWLVRLLSNSDLLHLNYSASCSLLQAPACLGWQQAMLSCAQPLGLLSFHCDLLQAANFCRKVPQVAGCERKGSLRGRRHPLSFIEGNQRYPAATARQEGVCCQPGLSSPGDEYKDFPVRHSTHTQEEYTFEEEEERIMMMERKGVEPSTSADSGCSCSIPTSTPSDDMERNETRFQELRNKWEQMGNAPVELVSVPTQGKQALPVTKSPSMKPPIGRIVTPESTRRGQAATGRRVVPPASNAASEKKSQVVMRSKLPSPVRAQTPESRPQTPESPQRSTSERQGSVKGRGRAGAIRKSLIPVHTPASAAKVKRTPQQPLRPPNRNGNL